MKVYSWPIFLSSLIAAGGFVYFFRKTVAGELTYVLYCILFAYLLLKGIYISFSKEAFEENQKREQRLKCVYRKLFGRFAPVMPYSAFILLLLGVAGSTVFFQEPEWPLLIFSLVFMFYSIWLAILIHKYEIIEKSRETLERWHAHKIE